MIRAALRDRPSPGAVYASGTILYYLLHKSVGKEGAGQVASYLYLAVMQVWIEDVAIHLRSNAAGASTGRVMSTR
jgi:hypothetical protein